MQKANKHAGSVVTFELDFARTLETLWRPGHEYSLTNFIRPVVPNGFEYEATNAGQTAQDEPDWPITIDDIINDGSVEWTCRDFAGAASDSISAHSVTPEAGIVVDSSSISDTSVLFTISGGTVGKCYDITIEIDTSAGDTYADILRLTITE